jgi:hypothetical protein
MDCKLAEPQKESECGCGQRSSRREVSQGLPFRSLNCVMSAVLGLVQLCGPRKIGSWQSSVTFSNFIGTGSILTSREILSSSQRNLHYRISYFAICIAILIIQTMSFYGWGAVLQVVRSAVRIPMRSLDLFSMYLVLPAAPWPCVRLGLWEKLVRAIFQVEGGGGIAAGA